MLKSLQITLVATSIGIVIIFLCVIIKRICCQKKRKDIADASIERAQNLQNGIAKLQQVNFQNHDQENINSKANYNYGFLRGVSSKPVFNWADHPSLVTEAVENGWSRFAFSPYNITSSSPSIRSGKPLLGSRVSGEQAREMGVETSWEVCQGSADFMQKIRLKQAGSRKNNINIIKTGLPLPGPPLGNSSFPHEAYFEITILSPQEIDQELIGKVAEGEKIKLIKEDFNAKSVSSESLIHVTSVNGYGNIKNVEMKCSEKDEEVVLSVGLTGGGVLPLKLPGSFPSSIGFNSNGSVFLDGIKLVFESEMGIWGKPESVIGCGYNPTKKKVFFTVDSQLVHQIHCKSETFSNPLYPTLASSNSDITILVNLGQCAFKYSPANLQRTSNPCFIGPLANSPVIGYDDSRELFSMGRIDSQWLNRSTARGSTTTNSNNNGMPMSRGADYDEDSEGDLFEIVLDSSSSGRSPYTTYSTEQLRMVLPQ